MGYALTTAVARKLCVAVRKMWGADAEEQLDEVSILHVWAGERDEGAPAAGTLKLRWHEPNPGLTTIAELAWDPQAGGSEAMLSR